MGRENKDGVTLIAEAIRKERKEKAEAKRQTTVPNVSEVTAQFVNNKATPTRDSVTGTEKAKTETGGTDSAKPNAETGATESTNNNNEE